MARIILGILIMTIGISFLFDVDMFKYVFSIILIVFGLRVLTGWGKDGDWEKKSETSEDLLNEVAIFSPLYKTIKSDNFKGGKVVMVFAGGEIDLSQVKTAEKEIKMEFVAVFGGGKLIIPKDWRVNSEGTAVFGGYTNKAANGTGETVLNIKGAAIFGGVEIVN